MDSTQLYDRFLKLLLPATQLKTYEYPVPDSSDPKLCAHEDKYGRKLSLDAQFAPTYTCKNCSKSYAVNLDGEQIDTSVECVHHPGHWWDQTSVYSCCKRGGQGCCINKYHVNEGESLLSTYQNYVTTQPKAELEPNRHGVFAIHSHFCFTTHGIELTRIVVLDHNQNEVYNRLVKPDHPIIHYYTSFTGLSATDFYGVTTRLADVQQDLLQIFSSKTILVGHDIGHHMKALKMFHSYFVDTCQLYPHRRRLPYKKGLATLMKGELMMVVPNGARDPKQDAGAALLLAKLKL